MPRVKNPRLPNTRDKNERLKAKILKEAEEHRRIGGMDLREELARQRVQVKVGLGEVPDAMDAHALRILLPEEMWGRIFDYLTDDQDAVAYYHTCQLFQTVLKNARTAWMFKMVLPMVAPFLSKPDLLHCRLVSRQWRDGVDRLVDLSASQGQAGSCSPQLFAPFKFPLSPEMAEKLSQVRAAPENNGLRVPSFVAGSVRFELKSPVIDLQPLVWYLCPRIQPQIEDTLQLLGGSISLLTFEIPGLVTIVNGMGSEDYVRVLEHIFTNCPSLKTLHLKASNLDDPPFSRAATLPDCPSLRHLHFNNWSPNLAPCLETLLLKYSAQLETLETRLWNPSMFHRLPWPHLEKLGVAATHCAQWLPTLVEMQAPRLQMLKIGLDKSSKKRGPQLRQVLQAVGSFPRLEAVELEFPFADFRFQCQEIWEGLDPKQGLHALCTVTRLSLKMCNLSTCRTFGFLVYFPNVSSLTIVYGRDFLYTNFPKESADLVNLSNLLWRWERDDIEDPYKSSLWEVMPRLHRFQTVCTYLDNEKTKSKKLVYTRRGWEEYRNRNSF